MFQKLLHFSSKANGLNDYHKLRLYNYVLRLKYLSHIKRKGSSQRFEVQGSNIIDNSLSLKENLFVIVVKIKMKGQLTAILFTIKVILVGPIE